jgi:hypothetical protein
MFYPRIALIAIALVLGACSSTPRYAPADSVDDYGHFSSRLEENRYRIVYNGKASTGPATTRDYALLQAAELTLREGYDWFEIVDREMATSHTTEPATGLSYERTYFVERSCGLLGCAHSIRPIHSARMDTGAGRPRTKYSYVLEIVMGKGAVPADGGNYYEAATVAASLIAAL